VLITWELGGGLGHLVPIATLANGLLERGYKVTVAVRDLVSAGTILTSSNLQLLQAPHRIEPFRRTFDPPFTYAQMLHNLGFGSDDGLFALVSAWRNLIRLVNADVIVCEHSPIALLACQSLGVETIQVGTGFTIPPHPLPMLRDVQNSKLVEQCCENEQQTLEILNRTAARLDIPTVDSLSQIYSRSQQCFLLTYPELDHFGERAQTPYVGVELDDTGIVGQPMWPAGHGPRIFAYLKPLTGFREAVRQLLRLGFPTIIYAPGLSVSEATEAAGVSSNVRISTSPVNIKSITKSCDVTVCHGGHGLVSQMLLAGIPLVTIPTQLEQSLLCRRISECAEPLVANVADVAQLGAAVDRVIRESSYKLAARKFSQKYSGAANMRGMMEVIEWITRR
jgi:hypothetical protein